MFTYAYFITGTSTMSSKKYDFIVLSKCTNEIFVAFLFVVQYDCITIFDTNLKKKSLFIIVI